jgi:hypothetical protein
MFAYYAFKGLSWSKTRHALLSPVICAAWEKTVTPWGEFFYLKTDPDQLDRGKGIFGASLEEAQWYGQRIYLVAPDPRYRVALGTLGWRAEAAMLIIPLTTKNDAAAQIISAYYAGYPQVPGILAWAVLYVPPEKGCGVLRDILRDFQDEKVLKVIADGVDAIGKYGVPILEELSRSDNTSLRLKVLDACRRPVEYLRPLLQRFTEDDNETMRAYAALTCSAHGHAALPLLERLARDESGEVRLAVAKSIWRLGEAAIPILEELQRDEDLHVRHEASVSFQIVKKE